MQETDDDIIFVFGGDDPMVKLLLHAYLGRSVKLQIESFVYVQASKEQFRGRALGIAKVFLRFTRISITGSTARSNETITEFEK
jgi:hypothetical protein